MEEAAIMVGGDITHSNTRSKLEMCRQKHEKGKQSHGNIDLLYVTVYWGGSEPDSVSCWPPIHSTPIVTASLELKQLL